MQTSPTVKPPFNNPNAWRYERAILTIASEGISLPGWAHFNLCGSATGFTPDGASVRQQYNINKVLQDHAKIRIQAQ